MSRDDVLATLKKFKKEQGERFGLLEMGIFGSFSRGEETANSDIDIFIRTKKSKSLRNRSHERTD